MRIALSALLACALILAATNQIMFAHRPDSLTQQVIEFYKDDAALPPIFNSAEQKHLQDVKDVIHQGTTVLYGLVGIILSGLVFVLKPRQQNNIEISKLLRNTSFFLAFFAILFIAIPFDFLFNSVFHPLIFESGTWLFPSDSLLIQLYPQSFFKQAFMFVVAQLLALSAVFASGWWLFSRR